MLRKLRRSRHPTRGGAPTLPGLRVDRLRPGRARPLNGARSHAGEESDGQVFVTYRSPQGFSIKVPVSWTRTETASSVVFGDKQRRIEVSIINVTAAPIAARVQVARFPKRRCAIAIHCVREAKLPAGRSIQIRFTSGFGPSPAANKEFRLKSERYLITGCGKIAVLTLCAPAVMPAADLWKVIADSFRW